MDYPKAEPDALPYAGWFQALAPFSSPHWGEEISLQKTAARHSEAADFARQSCNAEIPRRLPASTASAALPNGNPYWQGGLNHPEGGQYGV